MVAITHINRDIKQYLGLMGSFECWILNFMSSVSGAYRLYLDKITHREFKHIKEEKKWHKVLEPSKTSKSWRQ